MLSPAETVCPLNAPDDTPVGTAEVPDIAGSPLEATGLVTGVEGIAGTLYSRVRISPEEVENMSSAVISAVADCGRASGSFARQLMTTSDSDRGTSGRTSISGGGSRVRTAVRTPRGVLAANGDFPASSS